MHDSAAAASAVDASAPASNRAGRPGSPSPPELLLHAAPAAAAIVSPVNATEKKNLDKATASTAKRTASPRDRQTLERNGRFVPAVGIPKLGKALPDDSELPYWLLP